MDRTESNSILCSITLRFALNRYNFTLHQITYWDRATTNNQSKWIDWLSSLCDVSLAKSGCVSNRWMIRPLDVLYHYTHFFRNCFGYQAHNTFLIEVVIGFCISRHWAKPIDDYSFHILFVDGILALTICFIFMPETNQLIIFRSIGLNTHLSAFESIFHLMELERNIQPKTLATFCILIFFTTAMCVCVTFVTENQNILP